MQVVENSSDLVPLYIPHSLYLKPIAKLNVTVALPSNVASKSKSGIVSSISNYEVMEKIRSMVVPDKFSMLKVRSNLVNFPKNWFSNIRILKFSGFQDHLGVSSS